MQNEQPTKRKVCTECYFPESRCLCQWVTPIHSPIPIIILQHPKEVKHAKNTVKLMKLGLTNIKIFEGESAADFLQIAKTVSNNPQNFSLCYPSTKSIPIETNRAQLLGCLATESEHSLIFIDASWRKALKMWHLNPWLHNLLSWHFESPPNNQYKIRHTNQKNSLSTLESVSYMLKISKDVDCKPLHQLFLKMQQQSFTRLSLS